MSEDEDGAVIIVIHRGETRSLGEQLRASPLHDSNLLLDCTCKLLLHAAPRQPSAIESNAR